MTHYVYFRTIGGERDWNLPVFINDAIEPGAWFVVNVQKWREQGGVFNYSANLFVPWHQLDLIELRDEANRGFTDFRRRMTE